MTRVKPPGKIDGKNPIYIYIARFQLKPGLVGTFVLNKFCIYILSEWSVAIFPSEFPRYRFRSNHRLFDLFRLEFRETIKRENTIVVGGTDCFTGNERRDRVARGAFKSPSSFRLCYVCIYVYIYIYIHV